MMRVSESIGECASAPRRALFAGVCGALGLSSVATACGESDFTELHAGFDVVPAELAYAAVDDAQTERAARLTQTLSPAERAEIIALLGDRADDDSRVTFVGRLVVQGDVIHVADDLLELSSNLARDPESLEKANIHLTIAPDAEDPNGNPIPGGPPRPDLYAQVESGQVGFWRPDLGRRYYVVVPDDAPTAIFSAFAAAAYNLESALPNDCIYRNFAVMRQSAYAALKPTVQALGSAIEVGYSTTACLNLAAGCANMPRLADLMISPGNYQNRMRLGAYIGLETDYDSPRDADSEPELTPGTARNVILHELSHILGFAHPFYSELDPAIDTALARVPQSSQGTVATFMFPTANPLFSPTPSAEDKRVLTRLYSGQCAYRAEYRAIGELCSTESESQCLAHGGACEVARSADDTRVERCRWHHFTDPSSCSRYSAGTWQSSNVELPATVFPGDYGACISASSALGTCSADSFMRTAEHVSGRCCAQFGNNDDGVFFEAFADGEEARFFCSDQKGLGEPVGGTWEFVDATDQSDFITVDVASGTAVAGWLVSGGDYTQEQALPANMTISNERLRSGCVTTEVTTEDDGESGIVFNYRNTRNYYVFDVIPNVRRRIRQVVNGMSTDLDVTPWVGPATWTSIQLAVCYGDGIHTFIDSQMSSRVSVDKRVDFVGTGGRLGLWNDMNWGARHAYLRSQSLVEGFALIH